MASQSISVTTSSVQSNSVSSTKIKVATTGAVYYAVGSNPVAYSSGNCAILPANVVRDVNMEGLGNKIAFLALSGTVPVSVTPIGSVASTAFYA